jgi:hypothetical protein
LRRLRPLEAVVGSNDSVTIELFPDCPLQQSVVRTIGEDWRTDDDRTDVFDVSRSVELTERELPIRPRRTSRTIRRS